MIQIYCKTDAKLLLLSLSGITRQCSVTIENYRKLYLDIEEKVSVQGSETEYLSEIFRLHFAYLGKYSIYSDG